MRAALRSPVSGRELAADTPHSLSDGREERWPVIDGIPFLRTERESLARDALRLLDQGRADQALARLLAEQDDWWTGAPAEPGRLEVLVRDRDHLSFRDAMNHLGFDRVGDYLAHRWSDPTYLAGLALLEAHWTAPDCVFELACGTGVYLRELSRRGVSCSGGDVVFSKLWLARHWIVGPEVELICFDAGSPWPTAGRQHDLVLCHDAFYFLRPQSAVADRLRAATADDGLLAVAHVHNSGFANLSAGASVTAEALAELFPGAIFYDDAELTQALVEARAPLPKSLPALANVEAFSLALGGDLPPRAVAGGLSLPLPGAALRRNPLYGENDAIAWPSPRYRDEYAARATYPMRSRFPRDMCVVAESEWQARTRELVDLPERW